MKLHGAKINCRNRERLGELLSVASAGMIVHKNDEGYFFMQNNIFFVVTPNVTTDETGEEHRLGLDEVSYYLLSVDMQT